MKKERNDLKWYITFIIIGVFIIGLSFIPTGLTKILLIVIGTLLILVGTIWIIVNKFIFGPITKQIKDNESYLESHKDDNEAFKAMNELYFDHSNNSFRSMIKKVNEIIFNVEFYLIVNKEKLSSYIVSIATVIILFIMAGIIKPEENTVETGVNFQNVVTEKNLGEKEENSNNQINKDKVKKKTE